MLKQTSNFNAVSGKVFCVCFLFALFSVNLIFPAKSNQIKGLIYCPLQKIWVKAHIERVSQNDTFKNICATDKKKAELIAELSLKTFALEQVTENLLFDYLEKGNQALMNNFPNLPKNEVSKQTKFETAANNFQYDFIKLQLVKITLPKLSRPPNYKKSNKFDFQLTHNLDKISRNINPRSPPVFS
jgi:hypothetical protein